MYQPRRFDKNGRDCKEEQGAPKSQIKQIYQTQLARYFSETAKLK